MHALGKWLGVDQRWMTRLASGSKYLGKGGGALGETVTGLRFLVNPSAESGWAAFESFLGRYRPDLWFVLNRTLEGYAGPGVI